MIKTLVYTFKYAFKLTFTFNMALAFVSVCVLRADYTHELKQPYCLSLI